MAYTDDGKYKYQERWQQGNTKRYSIKLFLTTDSDIIEKLDSVENRNGYLKELIRADIAKEKAE